MSKILEKELITLKKIIKDSIRASIKEGSLPNQEIPYVHVEIPAQQEIYGDFSTNIALSSAKIFRMSPLKIAQVVVSKIDLKNTLFDKVEIAGNGFINFFLNNKFYSLIVEEILDVKEKYGFSDFGQNKKVMVEFVSANPTGPMHMGNARGGALGDCLASVLEVAGFNVEREFYINDAGNQIEKFALSLDIRYQQIFKGKKAVDLPEDSYHGDDIIDLANDFALINGSTYLNLEESTRRKALIEFALPKNIEKMKNDLKKYRIEFGSWFHEKSLYESGEVHKTIEILKENDMTYEKDGALWYKLTKYGLEKDEVLIRKNGIPTYFAADIAYHRNKFLKRKFDICVDLLGADHHGHVARMQKAMEDLGLGEKKLDIVLFQLVRLIRDQKVVRMSKRTGKAIGLSDLLDEVPVDAARFIFNMKEANSQMDFDLDMAVKNNSENPVYYVQYAHARICRILEALKEEGISGKILPTETFSLLSAKEEKELIKHLSLYTSEIVQAAKNYDPARITRYVIDLATYFHKFYNSCKVRIEDQNLMQARVCLCKSTNIVIKNILTMFKISTPEYM